MKCPAFEPVSSGGIRPFVDLKAAHVHEQYYKDCTGENGYRDHESKQDFCDSCHTYAGVSPNCWDCHNVPEEKKA